MVPFFCLSLRQLKNEYLKFNPKDARLSEGYKIDSYNYGDVRNFEMITGLKPHVFDAIVQQVLLLQTATPPQRPLIYAKMYFATKFGN